MMELINNIWVVYLDTAIWLLLGLFFGGLVKAYIPPEAMQRWLGGPVWLRLAGRRCSVRRYHCVPVAFYPPHWV